MDIVSQLLAGVPPLTRGMLAISAVLMVLTSLDLVSPYTLLFSTRRIVYHREVWRILTSALFFGEMGIQFFWTFYMMMLYCGKLEEEAYGSRKADFAWCLLLIILSIAGLSALCMHSLFLSGAFISALTYLWGRKNPHAHIVIIFFTVRAPYLPWALCAISWVAGFPLAESLIGIAVGHTIYFFEDVFPLMPISKGSRVLKAPQALSAQNIYKTPMIEQFLGQIVTSNSSSALVFVLAAHLVCLNEGFQPAIEGDNAKYTLQDNQGYKLCVDAEFVKRVRNEENVPASDVGPNLAIFRYKLPSMIMPANASFSHLTAIWTIVRPSTILCQMLAETDSNFTHISAASFDVTNAIRLDEQGVPVLVDSSNTEKHIRDEIVPQILSFVKPPEAQNAHTAAPPRNAEFPQRGVPYQGGWANRFRGHRYPGGELVGPNHPIFGLHGDDGHPLARFDPILPGNPFGVNFNEGPRPAGGGGLWHGSSY